MSGVSRGINIRSKADGTDTMYVLRLGAFLERVLLCVWVGRRKSEQIR